MSATKSTKGRALHPTYMVMVMEAIKTLGERRGSSRQKIVKYITSNYAVSSDVTKVNYHVSLALKRSVLHEQLIQVKGKGAMGSFKIGQSKATQSIEESRTSKKPLKAKRKSISSHKRPVVSSRNKTKLPSLSHTGMVFTPKEVDQTLRPMMKIQPLVMSTLNKTFDVEPSDSSSDIPSLSDEEVTPKIPPKRKVRQKLGKDNTSASGSTALSHPKSNSTGQKKLAIDTSDLSSDSTINSPLNKNLTIRKKSTVKKGGKKSARQSLSTSSKVKKGSNKSGRSSLSINSTVKKASKKSAKDFASASASSTVKQGSKNSRRRSITKEIKLNTPITKSRAKRQPPSKKTATKKTSH